MHDTADSRSPNDAAQRLSTTLAVLCVASLLLYATIVPFAYWHDRTPPMVAGALLYPLAFLLYFAALYTLWRQRSVTIGLRRVAMITVGGGILFRLTVLCSPVPPNQDLWRYLWEGRVLLAGKNTYAAPPESPAYDSLRAQLQAEGNPLWEHMCPPDSATDMDPYARWAARALCGIRDTYGLVASVIFAAATLLPLDPILSVRITMTLFDVGACLILLLMLRTLGRNPLWALVYCWNPLCINSFADRGQSDGPVVFLIVLSAWLLIRKRPAWAGAMLALALGVKVSPALLVFPFARYGGRRFALAFALVFAAILAPVLAAWPDGWSGCAAMANWWRGEDSIYTLLTLALRPLLAVDADRVARMSLVAMGLIYALWRTMRTRPDGPRWLLDNALYILAAGLFLSPVVYPWYATEMVAFLCFLPSPALLLLSAGVMAWFLEFLRPYCEDLTLWPTDLAGRYQQPWRVLVYGTVYGLLLWEKVKSVRARRSVPRVTIDERAR